MLEQEPAVFPELEVFDFFVEGVFAEVHFVLKTDSSGQVAHFFDVPAVVVSFPIWNEPLCQLVRGVIKLSAVYVFFQLGELFIILINLMFKPYIREGTEGSSTASSTTTANTLTCLSFPIPIAMSLLSCIIYN